MIARLQYTVNRRIQRIHSIQREDDSLWTLRANQTGDGRTNFIDGLADFLGFGITTSPYGCAESSLVIVNRLVDGLWLRPASCGVVEIDSVPK